MTGGISYAERQQVVSILNRFCDSYNETPACAGIISCSPDCPFSESREINGCCCLKSVSGVLITCGGSDTHVC